MDNDAIAKKLISLRGDKTQAEVAKALNISQSTFAMYETGRRVPTDEIKIRIANYFNKSVQEIFYDHILA